MAELSFDEEDNIVGNPSQAQDKIEIRGDVTESIAIAAGAALGYPDQALAVARQIAYGGHRARALAGLAPYLPGSEREAVLRQALADAAQTIWSVWDQCMC